MNPAWQVEKPAYKQPGVAKYISHTRRYVLYACSKWDWSEAPGCPNSTVVEFINVAGMDCHRCGLIKKAKISGWSRQYWGAKPESIFYTPSGGIWQNVWMEVVPSARISDGSGGTVIRSNDIETGKLRCKIAVAG